MRLFNSLITCCVGALVLGSVFSGCEEKDDFSSPTAKALDVTFGSGFNNEVLRDVSIDADQNMYVSTKTKIYKVDANGSANVYAGSNTAGITDGQGAAATFKNIGLITFDGQGSIYVVDSLNLRKVDQDGNVTSIVIDKPGPFIFKPAPPFNSVALPVDDQFFVAWTGSAGVFKVKNGNYSFFAGTFDQGFVDGGGSDARFTRPLNIILDETGDNLIVADGGSLRKIALADSTVTTFTGAGTFGTQDGTLSEARYQPIQDLVLDKNGNYYLSTFNTVRKISSDGQVTTIAGPITSKGEPFNAGGLAVDGEAKFLYITDVKKPAMLIKIDLSKF